MPRVSVVIPAYEPGDLLMRALESVRAQTMTDLEVIVVDDGSSQDLSWVHRLPDSRIRMVRHHNAGVSVSRNAGVWLAQADLVAFLDQDDEWLPTKLERQLEAVQRHPGAGLYHTGFAWTWPGRAAPSDMSPVTYRGLLSTQMVCLSTALLPKEQYVRAGGHNPLLTQAGDFDLFVRVAMLGCEIVTTPEILVRYHLHGENASVAYAIGYEERQLILHQHLRRAERLGDAATAAACRTGLARTREIYGSQAIEHLRSALADHAVAAVTHHTTQALRIHPSGLVRAVQQAASARLGRAPTGWSNDR